MEIYQPDHVETKILADLAWRARCTPRQALGAIIREFAPSTDNDKAQLKAARQARFNQDDHGETPINAYSWRKGFNAGWELFQLRKATSIWKLHKLIEAD